MNLTCAEIVALSMEGKSPALAVALVAARAGRLWSVDTGNDGEDCVLDADSAEDALEEVRCHVELDEVPASWSARAVTVTPDAESCQTR